MPIRTIATLAVAVFLGLIAVLLVRAYLATAGQAVGAKAGLGATGPVVVAAAPIARGSMLGPKLLKVVQYPAESIPEGAFHSLAEFSDGGDTARLALRNLSANEPVLPSKVSGPGGKLNLSGVLSGGMRAVSLRSNDVTGVAGFVLPGDRVDILLTRSVGERGTVTQVLAENVRVLGVDQSDNDEADKPVVARAVTVEVTPDQSQKISLAQAVGSVSLALRHVADQAALVRQSTTVADLGFGGPVARPRAIRTAIAARRAPALPPTPSNMTLVQVTRGTETAGYPVSIF